MNKKVLRFALIGIGVLFILTGIHRGEVLISFTKAINICLECIGIG